MRNVLKGGLRNRNLHHVLVVLFAFVTITCLLSLKLPSPIVSALSVGAVSPVDIQAPRNLEIDDEEATKEAQDKAAAEVAIVFTPRVVLPDIDANVRRTFEILTLMRKMDANARAGTDKEFPIALSPESIDALLHVQFSEYENLYQIIHTSIAQVLRDKITEQQLDDAKSKVADVIRPAQLPPPVKAAVTEMARNAMRANWAPDYQATDYKQREAMNHTDKIKMLLKKGQMIVRKGELVTPQQMEVLDAFGLHKQTLNEYVVLANALFVCLMIFVIGAYLTQQENPALYEPRMLWLMALSVVAVLGMSRAGVGVSPYITPISTASLLIAILVDYRLSLLVTAFLGLCIGIMTTGMASSDLSPCIAATITGMVAVLSVTKVTRRGDLMIAVLIVWLMNAISVLVVSLWHFNELGTLATDAMYGCATGLGASILAVGALPLLESIFNVTTHIKLLELSNHTTEPLLQRLMTEAPGTYHHSMIVANLAEAAARSIGADALLSKVGAFYHDIGKMKAAHFFVENQLGQENPHDRLTPMLSAHIIISHVQDGMEMARLARLPQVVADFIDMHHGDRLVSYFYHKALQRGDEAQERDFRYHGRRPRTKETAVVMMADTIEAKARLLAKPSQESLDNMVRESIKVIMGDGQLNDSDLSLRDIEHISQAFVKTLMSIYHSRIEYPKDMATPLGDKKPKESIPSAT